jgi:excisionase family DNA binding protein
MNAPQPRPLTIAAAAEILTVHSETIRRLIRAGKLGCLKIGGYIRISRPQIEEYLKASERPAGGAEINDHPKTERAVEVFRREQRINKALDRSPN